MKNLKFRNTLLVGFILLLFACNSKEKQLINYFGFTQGSTFSIKFYASADSTQLKQGIDSILADINHTASTYDTNSIISKVNNNQKVDLNNDFVKIFNKSIEVSKASNGCFDITVGDLVKAWGFHYKKKQELTKNKIDSLLQFVGYTNLSLVNNKLIKKFPETTLDFNAIAQGYTIDMVAEYLLKHNCTNFIIEIGGEVRVNGTKVNNEKWVVGIEKPAENEASEQVVQEKVSLNNKSISTSGNYRKYFIKDGIKYSHEIDPKTGAPVQHSLLSVSVIANDCTTADAYATAFMIMGVDKSKEFLRTHPDMEAYFIYSDTFGKNHVYFTNQFFNQGE